jgi:hypothetical protein
MRKANLRQNHEPFDAALGRYRAFMEKVVEAQRVVASMVEKRDIAESVLLRLCANWEAFVDEHLVDCINCDHSLLTKFFGVSIPKNPSKDLCQALVFGDTYRDFKSFGDLKTFSKKILPAASNPFLEVSTGHSKKIDEVYKIRNYLSHYSAKGRRSLMIMYRDEYEMDRCLEPGQFLLAYRAKRLWTYFDAFEGASTVMKAWCD